MVDYWWQGMVKDTTYINHIPGLGNYRLAYRELIEYLPI
jgi:hypothetical protein